MSPQEGTIQRQCDECGAEKEEEKEEEKQTGSIQAKLTIGQPGDKYEEEADTVARQVMSMPEPVGNQPIVQEAVAEENKEELQAKPIAASITPLTQRKIVSAKEFEAVQAKNSPDGKVETSSSIESKLSASQGGGNPLSDEVRSFMEPRFGADFSAVRVHTNTTALQMNKELGAQAFAYGSDIYYGAGKYPGKDELTAHELTHTIQQTGRVDRQRKIPSNLTQINRDTKIKEESHGIPPKGAIAKIDKEIQTKQQVQIENNKERSQFVQMKCAACEGDETIQGLLEAAPSLPMFGLLWPMLKAGVVGFLKGVKGQKPATKVAITNKLAKIISGGSPAFIVGFVKGLLKGIWEGLTDPFILMYEGIKGLGNLITWLNDTANEALSPQPSPATDQKGEASAAPKVDKVAIGQTLQQMGQELQPPATQVTEGFMPAVKAAFSGGEGLTFEGLRQKLGEAWGAVESAITNAGGELAQKVCAFMMEGTAEGQMGETVGWLAGTIAFEVALAILTAGGATAAKGAMKVLQTFAKILDWTGEALGLAFKGLAKLGGFVLDIVKGIGKLLSHAGGAAKTVLSALGEIGEKLIKYASELLGKVGKSAAGEVVEEGAQKATKETVEAAAEKGAKEVAEAGAEKSTNPLS